MSNVYEPANPYWERLAKRLKTLREEAQLTEDKVASELGYANRATISRWETNKNLPPLDKLAHLSVLYDVPLSKIVDDFETEQVESPESHWLVFKRKTAKAGSLSRNAFADVERGIEILEALNTHKSIQEIFKLDKFKDLRNNQKELFALLRSALISGEVVFSSVLMAPELEKKVAEKYPNLRNVVRVVDVSKTDITEMLPAELVAWVAAKEVMPELRKQSRVGLGFGYTLSRMFMLTPPTVDQFRATKWVPLLAYADEEDMTARSANHHAALLVQRHYFSESVPFRYFPPSQRSSNIAMEQIRKSWQSLDVALVSGFTWNRNDIRIAYSYREIFQRIEREGKRESIVGEFLGHILDTDGNPVYEGDTDLVTTRIPLADIERCAQEGKIYFIGYGKQKTPIVKVLLKKGYINGLITDSGLAEELLK